MRLPVRRASHGPDPAYTTSVVPPAVPTMMATAMVPSASTDKPTP
jgi:hypothetical protein